MDKGSRIGSIVSKKNGMFVSVDNNGDIREAGIGNPITECSFIAAPNSIVNSINGTYYTPLSYYISNFSSFYILIFIIIYYTISTIFHSSIHSFSSPFLYNHQTIISFSIFYILPLFYIAYTIPSSTLLYILITFHNLFKTISNLYILFYIFIIITIHFINIQPIPYSLSTISYSIIRYSTKE